MEIGEVREGREGKKYAYIGGDPKSKASWQEMRPYIPSGERPSLDAGSVVASGLKTANDIAGAASSVNPLMFAAQQSARAVSPENAYEAGGKVTDLATKAGASPEVAAGAGYVTDVGVQAIPTILSGNIVKPVAESILKPAGRWFMQKAIKPNKEALASGDAARAVETMLKEGKNVTSGGVSSMVNEVKSLSGQVDDAINAAEQSGATVSKVSMLRSVSDELKKLSAPLDSADDVKQAKAVLDRILQDPRFKDLDEIPIRMAQDLKTSTYKSLGEKAYNQADNMTTAKIGTLKAAVRGLKEGIERSAPGVVAPNKRMSELLNAIEVVEPGALAAGNKNLGGLAYLAENPFAAGGFMLDRSAAVNSILGRSLYSGAPSIVRDTTRLGTGIGMGVSANR